MPRIDPIQLLNCLSVLLSPNGGIKSRDEVQRLASLMTKFSKKLVSKCIYIQILKCTETELLGLFMGSGGWLLVHMWLTESIVAKNWPLVKELLELLLLCPVDIERLKTNNCPKLVKELSKDDNHFAIRALASKLVEQWLKTVKGEQVMPVQLLDLPQIVADATKSEHDGVVVKAENNTDLKSSDHNLSAIDRTVGEDHIKVENNTPNYAAEGTVDIKAKEESTEEQEALPVLKISVKDGKQVVSQVDDENDNKSELSDTEKSKDKHKNRSRSKTDDKNNSSSRSNSSKHSSKSHSSSEKHKSSHKSGSSRHSSSKDRSKDTSSKDKHSSHSSKSKSSESSKKSSDKSSSSSKSKDDRSSKSSDKDKSKDKEKDDKNEKKDVSPTMKSTNDKLDDKTPSIQKLGKIPKLSDAKKDKLSISIEVRKPDEPKPKTVKTFNSKFRKHGLEEEMKPPPSRAAILTKKPVPPILPPTVPIPKRPSPVHNEPPPEKKPKTTTEPVDKPGAIKLIPPKPKPMLLLESDMFMDALNASATNKKEPKKRKRRTSGSKDGNTTLDGSPPHTPNSIMSPTSENKSVPPRFYQDTLEADNNKEKVPETIENTEPNVNENESDNKMETSEPHTLTINGLKGVLCYHKRKGPKKSIKWKPEPELEEIQYFELDETERVNVTKTFTDMKYLERVHERESFQKARNLSTDDVMEEKTSWRPLIPVDTEGQIHVEYGKGSKEKDIQAIRQKGTLQPLYFSKAMIPDSALEPDPEPNQYSEPTIIPLDDVTGNQDNVSDFRNMPWPEPKGNAPPASANMNIPTMFPANINQFPNGFPNPQFPGVPGFQGAGMVPTEWQNGMPPQMIPNGMPGPMPPGAIPPGSMPPGMMMPPEAMMMEMFGPPNPMFPVPPDGFNMQPNMFPMDFNVPGPQGPPGPDNFAGNGNFRGAMRGRGGGHWRGKNAGNWDGPPRGRGGARGGRKTVCIYFQRKGSCRQGDNCTFLHPGVNCPF